MRPADACLLLLIGAGAAQLRQPPPVRGSDFSVQFRAGAAIGGTGLVVQRPFAVSDPAPASGARYA